MAYIPPGAIRAYENIKKIIAAEFSDKARDPYITISKIHTEVIVSIRANEKTTTYSFEITDVERLIQIYTKLCEMDFEIKLRRYKNARKPNDT